MTRPKSLPQIFLMIVGAVVVGGIVSDLLNIDLFLVFGLLGVIFWAWRSNLAGQKGGGGSYDGDQMAQGPWLMPPNPDPGHSDSAPHHAHSLGGTVADNSGSFDAGNFDAGNSDGGSSDGGSSGD